jgi:hypothetical protein
MAAASPECTCLGGRKQRVERFILGLEHDRLAADRIKTRVDSAGQGGKLRRIAAIVRGTLKKATGVGLLRRRISIGRFWHFAAD